MHKTLFSPTISMIDFFNNVKFMKKKPPEMLPKVVMINCEFT